MRCSLGDEVERREWQLGARTLLPRSPPCQLSLERAPCATVGSPSPLFSCRVSTPPDLRPSSAPFYRAGNLEFSSPLYQKGSITSKQQWESRAAGREKQIARRLLPSSALQRRCRCNPGRSHGIEADFRTRAARDAREKVFMGRPSHVFLLQVR
jgi:hypothetical protein